MENSETESPIQNVKDATIVTITGDQHPTQPNISIKPFLFPILTSLHAGYFRITLSFGAQALLWKVLSESTSANYDSKALQHVIPSKTFLLLWYLSLFILTLLSLLYILKCFLHFQLAKAEFLHHVGANYFFTPWISWLLLLQSLPKTIPYQVPWWIFAIPIMVLDVKIYGQWFTTDKRFLSIVANPTSQISVIGNLVGARAATQIGWNESAVCMFSFGMVHYLVVFVTLYQQLSGCGRLPAMLRPVFFLFIATPSMASLAWKDISGSFDTCSKMLFFLSFFFFTSLVCRPKLFKKSMRRFSVAWWAYSFPLTFLALASIEYAKEVKGHVAPVLKLLLLVLSVLVFLSLLLVTSLSTGKLFREKDPLLILTSDVKTKA